MRVNLEMRHKGVNCSVCGEKDIMGINYQCTHCKDYHICSTCFNVGDKHNSEHGWIKLRSFIEEVNEIKWTFVESKDVRQFNELDSIVTSMARLTQEHQRLSSSPSISRKANASTSDPQSSFSIELGSKSDQYSQYSQYSHYEHYYQTATEAEEEIGESTLTEGSDDDDENIESQTISIRNSLRNSRMKTPRRGSLCRNWAGEIASLFDTFYTTNSKEEKIEIIKQIQIIISEFQDFVEATARRIIDDVGYATETKSLKPAELGGFAGGQKYIHGGVFFKLAIDMYDVYGGDLCAAKAAIRELQGLKCYLNAQIPGLHTPLMVVMDYRGYKITATPLLPISKETLVYGSNDGGVTVIKSNRDLAEKMKLAAKVINLKGHKVGTQKKQTIYGPGDIEGHLGRDGRFYVLDAARVLPAFPPKKTVWAFYFAKETQNANSPWSPLPPIVPIELSAPNWTQELRKHFPDLDDDTDLEEVNYPLGTVFCVPLEKPKQPHVVNRKASWTVQKVVCGDALLVHTAFMKGNPLFNLMRPEFLKGYKEPLSSDAFTFFQVADDQKKKDKESIAEAHNYLMNVIIPRFAEQLLKKELKISTLQELGDAAHRAGINYRFMGKVYNLVKHDAELKQLVLRFLVAGAVKVFLNTMFRRMKMKIVTAKNLYILPYYNMIFGHSPASLVFWGQHIKTLIITKYGQIFSAEELETIYDHRQFVDKFALLEMTQQRVGIVWKRDKMQKLRQHPEEFEKPNPLLPEDFDSVSCWIRNNYDEFLNELLRTLEKK
jgi:hypothetical protein